MPRQSDEEQASCPVIRTILHCRVVPTASDRRKCGAERVPFSGEGSSSVPSPVKKIFFEQRGRTQEQSALCAAHATPILHRGIALLFNISSVVKVPNSDPWPVLKSIQAPQSKHIADDDANEWKVIAEYATNHQHAMDAHES